MHLSFEHYLTIAYVIVSILMWAAERFKLPVPVQQALKAIGMDRLKLLIHEAGTYADKTPAQRREYVMLRLKSICAHEGIVIPESFLRMGVEYVFARMKGKF